MEPVIACDRLCKYFGHRPALEDLTLTVHRGETLGLVGPNGAGKTTAIRLLLGLLEPTSGSASVLGCPSAHLCADVRRRISCVLETPGIYEDLTVYQNLCFYSRLYSVRYAERRIQELLDVFGRSSLTRERAGNLSKGMKQKLAIARSLLHDPEVLFFDEPTSGLDPTFQRDVSRLIRELRGADKTIFLSPHHLREVERPARVWLSSRPVGYRRSTRWRGYRLDSRVGRRSCYSTQPETPERPGPFLPLWVLRIGLAPTEPPTGRSYCCWLIRTKTGRSSLLLPTVESAFGKS